MNISEAAALLSHMYNNAPKGEQVCHIHLFGILCASELESIPLKDVVTQAGLRESYVTEVNKGKNLAKYVEIKRNVLPI